jgi:hypothetical protein
MIRMALFWVGIKDTRENQDAGTNPTIAIYNACDVKMYNAMSSLILGIKHVA